MSQRLTDGRGWTKEALGVSCNVGRRHGTRRGMSMDAASIGPLWMAQPLGSLYPTVGKIRLWMIMMMMMETDLLQFNIVPIGDANKSSVE